MEIQILSLLVFHLNSVVFDNIHFGYFDLISSAHFKNFILLSSGMLILEGEIQPGLV